MLRDSARDLNRLRVRIRDGEEEGRKREPALVVDAERIEYSTLENGFEPMLDVSFDRGDIGGSDRISGVS
jgi:hypothetical protein